MPPHADAAYEALDDLQLGTRASGEREPDDAPFMDVIGSGGIDYVQTDVCCQGGFEMPRRIFEAKGRQGVLFACHFCWK